MKNYTPESVNRCSAPSELKITDLRDKIPGCRYIGSFDDIAAYIEHTAAPDGCFILMGAGDVNQIANLLEMK